MASLIAYAKNELPLTRASIPAVYLFQIRTSHLSSEYVGEDDNEKANLQYFRRNSETD
jgi:hypothetical protein